MSERRPVPHSTSDVHEPAAATAAVLTYAAVAGVAHVLSGIAWSYDNDPTGGSLKVENGAGTTVFSVSITKGGPGFIPFNPPLRSSINTALVITLASGGGVPPDGRVGTVTVTLDWKEPPKTVDWFPPSDPALTVEETRSQTDGSRTRLTFRALVIALPAIAISTPQMATVAISSMGVIPLREPLT